MLCLSGFGPVLPEEPSHPLAVRNRLSCHQRCVPVPVFRVHIGAALHKKLDRAEMPPRGRLVERGDPPSILAVDGGPMIEEELHDLDVTPSRGRVQWRSTRSGNEERLWLFLQEVLHKRRFILRYAVVVDLRALAEE